MSQACADVGVGVHDLVGVGFGPSNLALAIAISEHNGRAAEDAVTGLFLERQPRFGWHRGMLMDDATLQVSFLKDLVTLRNPASEFSFLCYLHSKDRLVDFINHKNLFPLRVEFNDYFEWAAAKVDDLVRYGTEVVEVRPVVRDGSVALLDVVVRTAHPWDGPKVYRTRNLVFGLGLHPHLPEGVIPSRRIWHNHDLLTRLEGLPDTSPSRFVVVGAGQSAAEVTAYLHRRFPKAEVCAVFSRYGYSPADDSSFVNRIFDPAAVDEFFAACPEVKRMLLDYHRNTNYSVVDNDLIDDMYRRVYQEKVLGSQRLRLLNVARLVEVVETETGVRTSIQSLITGEKTVLDSDVLIYATGYRPSNPLRLLGELGHYCYRDEEGRLRVERDYRVLTSPQLRCGIYLQGGTEHTHGISSSLLSNSAVRAGEILQSVIQRRQAPIPRRPQYATSHAGTA